MKKLLLFGAAAAALACAGPAFAAHTASNGVAISGTSAAATASNGVAISGTSPDTCTLDSGVQGAVTNAAYTPGTGASTLAVTALASATDATLQATSATITFTGMCNYAHNVGLKSTNSGLQNANITNNPLATSGSFIKKVGYTASYVWGGHTSKAGETLSFSNDVGTGASAAAAATTGSTAAIAGANRGNLVLQFDIAASTVPVVAGTYTDTLTVQIGASL